MLLLALLLLCTGFTAFFSSAETDLVRAPAAIALIGMVSAYVVGVLIASALVVGRNQWNLFPLLLLVFPCYHFGYGCGFLRGVWDFEIVRKGAHPRFQVLTR